MLYPLSYEGIVPICRGFSSATAGPEYQSCEKVAKSAGNVRRGSGTCVTDWLRQMSHRLETRLRQLRYTAELVSRCPPTLEESARGEARAGASSADHAEQPGGRDL